MTESLTTTPQLRREMGLLDSTFLAAGIIVGSGSCITSGIMALEVSSGPMLLLAWVTLASLRSHSSASLEERPSDFGLPGRNGSPSPRAERA